MWRETAWQVDPAGGRRFDVRTGGQPGLEEWKEPLALALRECFPAGTQFDFEQAWRWVADEQRPFDKKRLRGALELLRDTNRLVIRSPKTGKPSRQGFPSGRPIEML